MRASFMTGMLRRQDKVVGTEFSTHLALNCVDKQNKNMEEIKGKSEGE